MAVTDADVRGKAAQGRQRENLQAAGLLPEGDKRTPQSVISDMWSYVSVFGLSCSSLNSQPRRVLQVPELKRRLQTAVLTLDHFFTGVDFVACGVA